MKIRIISLFLSVVFLSILTFEYISNTVIVENSKTKKIENVIEKRLADKSIDDNYLLSCTSAHLDIKTNIFYIFQKVIYSFQINNTLYRPPIAS